MGKADLKQQINLYQVKKEKKKLEFTFQYMLILFGGFLSVLLLITAVNLYKHLTIKKELTVLSKEQLAKNQKLQVIANQVPEEQTRNQIIAEINKYQAEKQEKEEVLQLLINAQVKKIDGFSDFFESLARGVSETSGIWLTHFTFKEGGDYMSLEGKALKPDSVTRFIAGLSKEAPFKGKSFELFKVSLDEKTRQIEFVLETRNYEQP